MDPKYDPANSKLDEYEYSERCKEKSDDEKVIKKKEKD